MVEENFRTRCSEIAKKGLLFSAMIGKKIEIRFSEIAKNELSSTMVGENLTSLTLLTAAFLTDPSAFLPSKTHFCVKSV